MIREALREHVGDGDGADQEILADHDRKVRAQALTDAAAEIQRWRDEWDDGCVGWTSRDWRDWLIRRADKEEGP